MVGACPLPRLMQWCSRLLAIPKVPASSASSSFSATLLQGSTDCLYEHQKFCFIFQSLTLHKSLSCGQQLHARAIKSGAGNRTFLANHLINFYSKCQNPGDALLVFEEIPAKLTASWSSIISSFAQNELPHLALKYFREMLRNRIMPDDHIFPSGTKSCAILSALAVGSCIHSFAVKIGFVYNVFVGSSLVDMYGKCCEVSTARKLFEEMPERNVVSWSGLIYGYAQLGDDEEALRLFKLALLANLDVNDFTFSSVVRVCGHLTLLFLGSQVHSLCVKTSFVSSSFVGSSLVSLYSKCGVIENCYQLFAEMPEKNLGAWNSMLIACAQHGHTETAFSVFDQMKLAGSKPNFITFLCLLYACSHSGLVKEGELYFKMMDDFGIHPEPQHYSCMIDLFGRAGKLSEAVEFVKNMPMKPTESVWGALLTGSRIHGNPEIASLAAAKLIELGSMTSGMHMLLSNAYAAAGRWAEAARARKEMRDRGVRKETGLSWIEDGNRIHTFSSTDRSHPMALQIYTKLEELRERMEKTGYVADTSFVLRDLDGEEKKVALSYHSERLAIAFGLVNLPAGRPIRVMKNLRVCGDCHTVIKFISKDTGRTIILRDINRFHRFVDGVCSCGDFW